ncbi:uncharacterized protein ELE39_003666 [Cryptosporidium sp. chipmunk genotype I]|uniref:uncharacterized protein n=1 Tax=Cryptosporidium sp. chipmunk genotype I TaxID=1280935 RepID=UPI00351A75A8|nr:hypothetical protein ELE39_003666 [Cryptosporidium sp. chipmunk genotype I]
MVKFTLKNTTVIILILACLGNVVRSQKQEKTNTEVRSLGHRRGGFVGEQTVFVDRPYFVEQPVYYPYPYQYQYPYSYTYQYPYTYTYGGVPGYPYNYSYSYTRTTSRPGGIVTHPIGYISPLPYAPLPAPYLRYLGNESGSNERKMDTILPMENMTPGFINDLQSKDGILSTNNQNNNLENPSESSIQRNQTSSSGLENNGANNFFNKDADHLEMFQTFTGLNRAGLAGSERIIVQDKDDDDDDDDDNDDEDRDKNIQKNSTYNETSVSSDGKKYNNTSLNTPEIVYYNNTSNLRVLAKKSLLERVEEKVNDVFDGLKKKSSGSDDQVKDLEKEDDVDENNNNSSSNSNKKSQNGGKMIKQVFSTIEDIVSNTLAK